MSSSDIPQIAFQDDDYIIAAKPCGWISGNNADKNSLLGFLSHEIGGELHPINRLDRPVSGLVFFAKSPFAAKKAQQLFQDKEIQKTYFAVVPKNPPPKDGTLRHYFKKDTKRRKAVVTDASRGKEAMLQMDVLDYSDRYALLKISTKTGRFHQIRAQLAAAGHPIKGDTKYGAPRAHRSHFIHLHAAQLEFVHPMASETIKISCLPKEEVLWDFFKERILAEINS